MMMFHELAGGEEYTRLTSNYQPFVDFSGHLSTGQAILVGRTDTAAATWRNDGESIEDRYGQKWSFYRLVLPVRQLSAARLTAENARHHGASRS